MGDRGRFDGRSIRARSTTERGGGAVEVRFGVEVEVEVGVLVAVEVLLEVEVALALGYSPALLPWRALVPVVALVIRAAPAYAADGRPDPYDLPDATRPITLPELTHREVEWTSSTAFGEVSSPTRTTPEVVERLSVELPIGLRRWFAGAAYEAAYGAPLASTESSTIVGGNVEIYGRGVWATRTGLAFGAGLGVLPPLATYGRTGQGADVASAASSLQPWDDAFFRPGELTFRPFIDVRDLFGPFVVQFRQSFDWSIQWHDFSDSAVSAASTLCFGWTATRLIGLDVEASEYYLIDAPGTDDQRAKFVFSSNVRIRTPGIQPAIGAFVGAHSMIAPEADSMWGLRFALTFVWDPRAPFFGAPRAPEGTVN